METKVFYALSTGSVFTRITEEQYRAHNVAMSRLYGGGYTLLLEVNGVPAYVTLETKDVRQTYVSEPLVNPHAVFNPAVERVLDNMAQTKSGPFLGEGRLKYGGVNPDRIDEIEGGEVIVDRLGRYARPANGLIDAGRRLTPDEITERVSAWRDLAPDMLKLMHDVVADGFRVGTPKKYRVFYHAGVYEWYENTGRAALWEYQKRGKLVGAYNVRAKMCAKSV